MNFTVRRTQSFVTIAAPLQKYALFVMKNLLADRLLEKTLMRVLISAAEYCVLKERLKNELNAVHHVLIAGNQLRVKVGLIVENENISFVLQSVWVNGNLKTEPAIFIHATKAGMMGITVNLGEDKENSPASATKFASVAE